MPLFVATKLSKLALFYFPPIDFTSYSRLEIKDIGPNFGSCFKFSSVKDLKSSLQFMRVFIMSSQGTMPLVRRLVRQ